MDTSQAKDGCGGENSAVGIAKGVTEYEIPHGYGKDRIVALVRDPLWLFTYWEVTDTLLAQRESTAKERWPQGKTVLRIYQEPNKQYLFDLPVDLRARNWYVYVGRKDTSFRLALGRLLDDGTFIAFVESNLVTTPPGEVSELEDEKWMTLEELYRIYAGLPQGESSPLVFRAVNKLEMEISSPSYAASPMAERGLRKPFWLVAHTELVIYGQTEPDASVRIQGQPVTLQADGSFTARYVLPDGRLPLPIEAVSADLQEMISITPIITKTTQ
ncbi:MAG: DUF4912 domain-containing protein [Limnochordia bacterium]|nr:DUF4912 domain-containing protein [Limnochordia bacterium]